MCAFEFSHHADDARLLLLAVMLSCDRRTGASRNATGIKARPKGRCVPSSELVATAETRDSPLSDGKLAARSMRRAAAVMWPACANGHTRNGNHARTQADLAERRQHRRGLVLRGVL